MFAGEGETCVPDQVIQALPSPAMVTGTASIAVVATTSALLAKPLADPGVKSGETDCEEGIEDLASLRGKKLPVLSRSEKIAEQRVRNHAIRKLKGKE